GRELISPLARAVRAAPEGVGRFPVDDSPDVYAAWYRLPSLGWTVTLGAPVTFVDAPLRRSLWRITMVGIVLAAAGGGIALVWARRGLRGRWARWSLPPATSGEALRSHARHHRSRKSRR